MIRFAAATAALALGLVFAATAVRAATPIDLQVKQFQVVFWAPNPTLTQDVRIPLIGGTSYWIGIGTTLQADGQLLDAAGRSVRKYHATSIADGGWGTTGYEYRPSITGVYTMRVNGTGTTQGAVRDWVRVAVDCPNSLQTDCSIDSGGRQKFGQLTSYNNDRDVFVLNLMPGGKYNAHASVYNGEVPKLVFSVLDPKGKVLFAASRPDAEPYQISTGFTFTLPAMPGPYYLRVAARPSRPIDGSTAYAVVVRPPKS